MLDSSSCPTASDALNIVIDNRPTGFPGPNDILSFCRAAGWDNVDIPFPSSDQPTAWIKYKPNVTRGEALTQHNVALAMNAIPNTAVHVPTVYLAFMDDGWGYIVMEFVPGRTVGQLFREPGVKRKDVPGAWPSRRRDHRFFTWRESAVAYRTFDMLQEHVNRILKIDGYPQRVNFVDEATEDYPSASATSTRRTGSSSTMTVAFTRSTLSTSASCRSPSLHMRSSIGILSLKEWRNTSTTVSLRP
ncbi:hypothetical protein BD410DRAFT_896824 [Rickenella mellea]|uniref:Aminoglycoside phosphotransferase domain-containing protein n=1 Tax=Rickenella mellea TaxID=50990 RepID=A0A4Y7QBP6_9AGAM|nr:hypothetical protein BD410DRAFT_896824 [Rickenella mellea]